MLHLATDKGGVRAKCALLLIMVVLLGYSAFAQNIVHLQFDSYQDKDITQLGGLGSLVPVSDQHGILAVSGTRILKVDLVSGDVLDQFNSSVLKRFVTDYVTNLNDPHVSEYSEEEIRRAPTCQRHILIYKRVFAIPNSSDALLEVGVSLRRDNDPEYPFQQLELIVRIDEDLQTKAISIRESDSKFIDGFSCGGAYVNDSTIVLSYSYKAAGDRVPVHNIYELRNNVYTCVQEVSQLNQAGTFKSQDHFMYPAAYLNLGDKILSTNGKVVVSKPSLYSTQVDSLVPKLHKYEAISHLARLNDSTVVGLRERLARRRGAWDNYTLFTSGTEFKHPVDHGLYDESYFTVNDISTLDGVVYVLLLHFDMRRMLVHKIDFRDGLPKRRFVFTEEDLAGTGGK